MNQTQAEWLPHLTSEVVADARGWNLDAYAVALEGWRRGLTLEWYAKHTDEFKDIKTWFVDEPGKLFSLRSDDRTHYFFRTRGDKVTNDAVEMSADKEQTKQYLANANIATPTGYEFKENTSDEEIMAAVEAIEYPVVLKPTDGSFGKGVITNIKNVEELKNALVIVRTEQNIRNVMIEQHIPGEEYRVYVVGDQAVAAMNRIPANITGDGSSSIRQLIGIKNEARKLNPRLISCLIQVDAEMKGFIESQGYTLDSVLKKEETLFLTNKSNISLGGDPVSVTDELPQEVKDTAVSALQAIPGLVHGAVDLIVDSRKVVSEAATIIELNATAQLGGLLFPVAGKSSDVPAAIIDYYFPETKDVNVDKTKLYFDFVDVLSPLNSSSAKSTQVTPMPKGKVYSKKYTVTGDVQNMGYHMGLRKQAFERYLSGLVMKQENGDIEVVVAGTDPAMVDDFKEGLLEDPERAEVESIQESQWDSPMKVGFEIRADLKTQADDISKLIQDIELTEHALKQAEYQQQNFYKSLSWRATAPIRWIGNIFK